MRFFDRILFVVCSAAGILFAQPTINIPAKATTSPTGDDVDDAAIWVHPTDGAKSVVVINDKGPLTSQGGLYVYNLNGVKLQKVPVYRPQNPDIRYNVRFDNTAMDVLVCLDREAGNSTYNKIRVFKIDPSKADASNGFLTEITVSGGIPSGQNEAYGHGLYKRPSDGALFSIVCSAGKTDFTQIRLEGDGSGKVKGTQVRKWGMADIGGDICEGICCDDELGYIYICDENAQVLKYWADPDKNDNGKVSSFAKGDGIVSDREGINIYRCDNNSGYLLLSSQGNNQIKVYDRQTNSFKGTVIPAGMRDCDGLDVTAIPAGTKFPHGFAAFHLGSAAGSSFSFYDWSDIAAGLNLSTACDAVRPMVQTSILEKTAQRKTENMIRINCNSFNKLKQKTVQIYLPEKGMVTVTVFDLRGKTVTTLFNGNTCYKGQTLSLTCNGLLSGVYLVQVTAGVQTYVGQLFL